MEEIVLRKGEAVAFCLKKGQKLRISSENGGQLADLVFLGYHQGLTLDNVRSLIIREGDMLFNSSEKPILRVQAIDSKASTNILYPGCRYSIYKENYGKDKKGCRELLAETLGISPNRLPSTINLFMDFDLNASTSKFSTKKSSVKAGDYVIFDVLENTVVAVSSCPCEPNSCEGNGYIKVKVIDPD
jgi:uncharacterized protein YcgI (DUF1989 family)